MIWASLGRLEMFTDIFIAIFQAILPDCVWIARPKPCLYRSLVIVIFITGYSLQRTRHLDNSSLSWPVSKCTYIWNTHLVFLLFRWEVRWVVSTHWVVSVNSIPLFIFHMPFQNQHFDFENVTEKVLAIKCLRFQNYGAE